MTATRLGEARARIGWGAASLAVSIAGYALVSNLFYLVDTSTFPRTLRVLLRPGILPPPQVIMAAFLSLLRDGSWLAHVWASALRVSEGLALALWWAPEPDS